MILKLGIVFAFVSVIFLPWLFTAGLAVILSAFDPLVPVALGIFTDALYMPYGSFLPVSTLLGAGVAIVAFFVRSRLKTSIM
jgi:hypothetical protein